jgi:O-antigen/teichoic acid export membrane protein
MLKKLGSVTLLSALAAFFNFISTFIIVRTLGLGVLGQFTLVNSITGMVSVIYTVLPANYSIFKYQDDLNYRFILTSFFLIANIPFILILFILYLTHSFLDLGFPLIVYNGLTTIAFYYYDIIYQATNRLYRYFFQLLFQAILKIIIIYFFYYTHLLTNNRSLIFAVSTAQLICLLPYCRDFIKDIDFTGKHIKLSIKYIFNSFNELKPYYLNSIIKRIKDNIIVVLFSSIISNELLGLYTLFVKITSFVLSLGRSFEAFFAFRDNMKKYHKSFNKNILLLGGCLQVIFLVVGIIYMKIYTHNFYTIPIVLLSFLVYPYSRFIVERMRFLGNYDNKELNISMFFYIVFVLLSFIICKVFQLTSVYTILLVYFVSELMNYFHLIYKSIAYKSYSKQ